MIEEEERGESVEEKVSPPRLNRTNPKGERTSTGKDGWKLHQVEESSTGKEGSSSSRRKAKWKRRQEEWAANCRKKKRWTWWWWYYEHDGTMHMMVLADNVLRPADRASTEAVGDECNLRPNTLCLKWCSIDYQFSPRIKISRFIRYHDKNTKTTKWYYLKQ